MIPSTSIFTDGVLKRNEQVDWAWLHLYVVIFTSIYNLLMSCLRYAEDINVNVSGSCGDVGITASSLLNGRT